MELIVKTTTKYIEEYINKGVTSFLFPLKEYATDYSTYYTLEEIHKIREKYKYLKIFIVLNKTMTNMDIKQLKNILQEIDKLSIEGIFYYDLAIVKIKQDLKLKTPLVFNATHMVTNYNICNYHYNLGALYSLLSTSTNLEEMVLIKNNTKAKIIIYFIGYEPLAFSKRKLLNSFSTMYKKDSLNTLLIKEKVSNNEIIVNENNTGTSFINNKVLNGSSTIKTLEDNNIDYILLNEDYIEHSIFTESITNIYNYLADKNIDDFINKQNKLFGDYTGFFYKEMIYKVKSDE